MQQLRNIRRSLGLAAIAWAVQSSGASLTRAEVYIGAAFPPTGSPSFAFSSTGDAGSAGGRTITYSGLDPSAYVSLYWGPSDANSVKMSLSGTTATTVLGLTSASGNVAQFDNPSVAYTSPGGPTAPPSGNYDGRATVTITGGTVAVPPAGVATTAVANLTGAAGFTANLLFTANPTGSFTPIRTLPTSTGVASSFSGGFFYIPRLNWIASGSGSWDTLANWNHTTIAPYADSPVTIGDATAAATVTAPAAATTVKRLTIGGTTATQNALLLTSSSSITTGEGTFVLANGRLAGAGTLNGGLSVASGGELDVSGTFNVGGGATLAGTTAMAFGATPDQLNVTGVVSVGGKLVLNPSPGFDPNVNTARDLIVGSTVNGVFSSIGGVTLSPNKAIAITYTTTAVHGTIAVPGDSNLDGHIDFSDLLALARNYGTTDVGQWKSGDFDGSGTVDFADLLALARHYGQSSAFAADYALAQSLAPEPATLCSFGAGAMVLGRRRRRR